MTEFIMLVGLPASGKSTYAEELKQKGCHIHSSDAIREELTGDVNTQDKNTDVFATLHKRIKEDLNNGISCVYDATNMSMKRRRAFLDEIKKYGCYKKCVLFVIPVEVCKERNSNRERRVPDEVFDKMLKSFWVPMKYEGWDEIRVIKIDNYKYDYPIVNTYNFDQKNSHHSYKLFEHMNQTANYIHDHTYPEFRKIDRYYNLMIAAYNHDIGKLITQTFFNAKGEKTDEAHYYGHDCAGAYWVLMNQIYNGYRSLKDILYVVALVNWHMRPYLSWKQSDRAKARDINMIGKEMYEDIMLLHEADRSAH